jgi:hypothetical protein
LARGKKPVFIAAFAVAIALSAGPRIASARADGPPQPQDLAAGITAYATSQINAAMAESTAAFSAAVQAQTPASEPQAPSGPPAQVDVAPQPVAPASPPVADASPVEITAALPQPAPPAPATDIVVPTSIGVAPVPEEVDPFLLVGIAAGHDLVRLTAHSNSVSRAGGKSVVRHTSFLRVDLTTRTTRTAATSSTFASAESRSSVRSTVKSSASGGRSRTPAAPKAPLSFPPFPPNAPAPPSSGVSSTGGGGGNGVLLTFSAFLAAFVLFGIHRLLRRVHWSGLRMPGRGAVLPWKPG